MKRLVKRGLKATWRWTSPLRRPFVHKLEMFLRRCLRPGDQSLANETDILMDHVVRELVRLQCRFEALQQTVLELLPAQEDPAIAGEIEPSRTQDEQLKAG